MVSTIHRSVFCVRERSYVLGYGPECGWLLGCVSDPDEAKRVLQLAEDCVPGWYRIVLSPLPTDAVLVNLTRSEAFWRTGSARSAGYDRMEREFVLKYAPATWRLVHGADSTLADG